MARLLLSWLQIHPAIGNPDSPGRIQAGAHIATDAEDFDAGRRYEPDTDIDRESFDARMAASPPRSVDDLLALVCLEVQTATGLHVTPQKIRPRPEPVEEAPAEPAPTP